MEDCIYIASTLSNAPRVRQLRDKLKTHGISLTYDWTGHYGGNLYVPDDQPIEKRATAERELLGVARAKAILVVMPGGRGTHFEFGAGYILKKPIVILTDQHTGDTPAFHFLDNIVKATTEEEAIRTVIEFVRGERKIDDHFIDRLLAGMA